MNTRHRQHLLLGTAFLTLMAGALLGCKDFLKDAGAPQGTLNDQTLLTLKGVEGSLIATYRAIEWNNGVGGDYGNTASNWIWGSVASLDAYKGSEASDIPAINDIGGYHWSTADVETYLNGKWRGVYEGVVRANATLRLLKQVQEEKPGEVSDANANGIRGEALFLRAHFHFEAWRMWGNVPYFTEDDLDPRKTQTAPADVPALLLADLNEAISLLPAAPRYSQKGRVTQWTAKAYKGRVQVYAGDYAGALTTLRDVQANGPYALETSFDHVWTGFSSLENGPETIFAYQASANDGEPNGNNANYGERLNFPHSGSPFGCCGFHQPSQNLVNFFAVDGAGLPLAVTDPTWNANNTTFVGGNLARAVDPRLDWTAGRDGVPFKDWGLHDAGWIRSPSYGGRYSPKKNIDEKAANAKSNVGWVPTQLNSVNMHIFRYADMLLLLAEAEVEAGSLNNALTIVNQIRTRAGVRAQGCGLPTDATAAAAEIAKYPLCTGHSEMAVPINDPTITWATYRVGTYPAFATQAYARTAVRYERRLELAMEGQRFFDLRRWGWAPDTLNAYVAIEKTRLGNYLTAAETFAARHRWYPLPAVQIELSKAAGVASLVQNPGW
jgi:hypothetical protein